MRRREFIALVGGATASWPCVTLAQQPAMPVIGYLSGSSAAQSTHLLAAFRRGLAERGYVESRNVAIEYRWADGQFERLPAMAADLVNRRVAVIVSAFGTPTIRAAKAATSTIPIVFIVGSDPVAFGLVASISRPGGNLTGLTMAAAEVVTKRLGLLIEMVPNVETIGVLLNPSNTFSKPQVIELEAAERVVGRRLHMLNASTDGEIETAFAAAEQLRLGALLVAADVYFDDRRSQIVALAARHRMPANYIRREFAVDGGLMSYGPVIADALRHAGNYAGRILQGDKPAELPVMQPTKFEFVLNLKTAKVLGIEVPATLLATADEVIE